MFLKLSILASFLAASAAPALEPADPAQLFGVRENVQQIDLQAELAAPQ